MKRHLFKLRGAIWMLLLAGIIAVWIRSLTIVDYVQWSDHRHFPGFVSSDGRLIYSYQFWPNGVGGNDPGFGAGSRKGVYWKKPDPQDFNTWAHSRNYLLGFEWSPKAGGMPPNTKFRFTPNPTTFVVGMPYWFLGL